MRWARQRDDQDVLPSERGLFELASRQFDLPLPEVFHRFRDLVSADMAWVDSRKSRFRRKASAIKVASLALAAVSTVVLGIDAIPARASIALPMVALVGALGAAESYFNWRSRWVLMEETRYRLNRLRDEIDFYLVATPSAEFGHEALERFFADQQEVWREASRRWVEFRKLEQPAADGGSPPDTRSVL
jgi:hypothetical protein